MQTGSFTHPGFAFIECYEHGLPTTRKSLARSVLDYAAFLRAKAGLNNKPPVDINRIYEAFSLTLRSASLLESLPGMQGLAAKQVGLVFISEDDPGTRQRFTQSHELMEFLMDALSGNNLGPAVRMYVDEGPKKEQLCDWGAARLLMPVSLFRQHISELGVSLDVASNLSYIYQTSLLATLRHIVECLDGPVALVVWRYAHKPTEMKYVAAPNQESLFGDNYRGGPQKELRVWWRVFGHRAKHLAIPLHKSVSRDSLIYRVYEEGVPQNGEASFNLVALKGRFFVEARPAIIGSEHCVISLFHLPESSLTNNI